MLDVKCEAVQLRIQKGFHRARRQFQNGTLVSREISFEFGLVNEEALQLRLIQDALRLTYGEDEDQVCDRIIRCGLTVFLPTTVYNLQLIRYLPITEETRRTLDNAADWYVARMEDGYTFETEFSAEFRLEGDFVLAYERARIYARETTPVRLRTPWDTGELLLRCGLTFMSRLVKESCPPVPLDCHH